MKNDITRLTLAETLKEIEKKSFSVKDVHTAYHQAIQEKNKSLNIYLSVDANSSKKASKVSKTPLKGLPIAVKDNVCTSWLPTTASSTVLEGYIPPYSATLAEKLTAAGGVVVGKTNLDAWAHGSSTETSQFGRTLNPRNPEHLPGGSSGGSAAAVAADTCVAAIGTETAGSIRQPAAWCGVVGLKPTYGRVSRYGVIAMASSTDSPGPITKTVEDAAIMLNHIAGHDPYDGTSSSLPVPDYTASLHKGVKGMKIALLYSDIAGTEAVMEHIKKAGAVFESLGASVDIISALDPNYAVSVYTVVQRGEVSSNLGRFDGIRYGNPRSFFGDEAKRRIMLGTYTLSAGYAEQYYNTAQKVRTQFIQDFERIFKKYDVVISATSPSLAKKLGVTEGEAMFGELEDMLLEPSSITGLPGISVPCYRDTTTHLFYGLNIMAPMWREDRVIQVADAFERATSFNTWRNNEN